MGIFGKIFTWLLPDASEEALQAHAEYNKIEDEKKRERLIKEHPELRDFANASDSLKDYLNKDYGRGVSPAESALLLAKLKSLSKKNGKGV